MGVGSGSGGSGVLWWNYIGFRQDRRYGTHRRFVGFLTGTRRMGPYGTPAKPVKQGPFGSLDGSVGAYSTRPAWDPFVSGGWGSRFPGPGRASMPALPLLQPGIEPGWPGQRSRSRSRCAYVLALAHAQRGATLRRWWWAWPWHRCQIQRSNVV
jgi:hypothetical protein